MGNSDQRAAEASIFICYRWDDSGYTTDRNYDWLNREFPSAVFRDLDAIPFGVDFRDHIRAVLESSQIVLAVIGPDWLTVTSNSGRRRITARKGHKNQRWLSVGHDFAATERSRKLCRYRGKNKRLAV